MEKHVGVRDSMSQAVMPIEEVDLTFDQWQLREAIQLEHKKQELTEERKQLEIERKEFEREKKEFYLQKQADDNRILHETNLFNMKWKILEDELRKLAAEKEQIAKQRDFYRYVKEFEAKNSPVSVIKTAMFFCGVNNGDALKKRYKDLIKIYHPDNLNGDKGTLQEINIEYEKLKALYE